MQKTPVTIRLSDFPECFHPLLQDAAIFDSSSSPQARVWFIDKENGYYLKKSAKDTLCREAEMTRYFHKMGLAAEVLAYESLADDWLLTAAIDGEDCVSPEHLTDPARLCAVLGKLLRRLHDTDPTGCPVTDHTATYLAAAEKSYLSGNFDASHIPQAACFADRDAAWQYVQAHRHLLKNDTLIHGDFCLPNIILKDWQPAALIDVDHGGIGDRHVDLFWAIWSLRFNTNTDQWADAFLDAYGRDRVDPEILRLIAAIEVFG
ncbi:MAG: aminoglycoside 3'-phosphotransferase [Clostridia bacterium]|nr:aminoglycoside 3'-phosphotransferase [Clostridia bacterium]